MKKYKITNETIHVYGKTFYRIKSLINFGNVTQGTLGGFIEKETNLSHDGNAWVFDDAIVCGNARVCNNADYLCFAGLGSRNRNTTFFKCRDGYICASCDGFHGNLVEFENRVRETYGNTKYAKEYLACVTVVKIHFGIE